jgi:transcriptional regulator with XRE-family HTH domain
MENLNQLVLDMLATGITQQQLADMVPCGQGTISKYALGLRGERPTMEIGNRLIALHKKLCRKPKK